jgi:type II secretory pathway pseudopilin PulG
MTILELMMAMVIMALIVGAVVPLLAGTRNSTETERARAEMVQSGRVLNEHLMRQLAQAVRVVAVSNSSDTDGHLEFEGSDGTVYRYEIDEDGYVAFGPLGDLAALAGPVECLQFVCYDAGDLAEPNDTPDAVRLVTWETTLRSPGTRTPNKAFTGACHLRTNGGVSSQTAVSTYNLAASRPGVDFFAFADEGRAQVPEDPGTPGTELTSGDYAAMAAEDDNLHVVAVSPISRFAQVRYAIELDEAADDVTQLTVSWCGKGINEHPERVDGARLYIWNYVTASYELLASSEGTESKITLTGSTDEAPTRHIGGAGRRTVVLLVVSNDISAAPKANALFTDYIRLDVVRTGETGALLP